MWDELLFHLVVFVPIITIETVIHAFIWRRVVVNMPMFSGYHHEEEEEEDELESQILEQILKKLEDSEERINQMESLLLGDSDGLG